jgi:hypothetical protein
MKNNLFWIAAGGFSFWLPAILVAAALHQTVNEVWLNAVSLVSLILIGVASWMSTKRFPKWGWVLAGIYILGPACMLAPLAFAKIPSSPVGLGGNLILILLCLFPPTTLWFSLLNGMIVSVLIATVTLPFLAVYQRRRGRRVARPKSISNLEGAPWSI